MTHEDASDRVVGCVRHVLVMAVTPLQLQSFEFL